MIGQIKGILESKQTHEILVDVNGLGYEIHVPMTTLYQLPELGASVCLQTHLSVREDAQTLFGFSTLEDKSLFRELIKVNGVGPKLALAILSGMTANEFVACIHEGHIIKLTKLPGVGKKTAERLLIDLKDRLKSWAVTKTAAAAGGESDETVVPKNNHSDVTTEASEALAALGYKPTIASKLVVQVYEQGMSVQDVIREALKKQMK
jgi:holliday junction DNA helicase RuvA